MAYYAVHYSYDPASIARQDELRPEHRAYLATLVEQGSLIASGPFVGAESPNALLIFRTESEQQVRDLLAEDPFQQANLVVEWSVTEWNPVLGVFAQS